MTTDTKNETWRQKPPVSDYKRETKLAKHRRLQEEPLNFVWCRETVNDRNNEK